MLNMDQTEEVYQFIWRYVTQHEALPSYTQIGEAVTSLSRKSANTSTACAALVGLNPVHSCRRLTATWWREHVRVPGSYLAERQS